ncbi:flagellar type III secretion system pore protein FliP [Terriglobus saanensis]|uniref:Flagellar biosynthetic protein FliP n=1 Tax=Terriglobus saanensis (strain ATCC BAA-1853 / DSM 23119 / SP1PR4) TaxID=401053 RepID=E8V501_TERSS|nr:flagellar type III secretion system pore protein FliP [Terriglobus saanensis]ADV82629.1 flagellar biosynthetic protein FliP [Terriglobus saanensis SP1PR4]
MKSVMILFGILLTMSLPLYAARLPKQVDAPARAARATSPSRATGASTGAGGITVRSLSDELNSSRIGSSWVIALSLTLLTLLPAIILAMTPMVRLLVVFHFLRQALGTQTAPSNQVLMALGLMMTWFLIQPVVVQIEQQAIAPYRAETITLEECMDRTSVPIKQYLLKYAREKDLALFASAGMSIRPQTRLDIPLRIVIPAYILSELKAGFQIGAVLFLPFLLIDLVVASITTSVGMLQLPPVVISTPIKILLFVMVDGWNLLAGSLLKSF